MLIHVHLGASSQGLILSQRRWSWSQTGSPVCPEWGRCGVADSVVRGNGGFRGAGWPLVPLFGVLLTVHHISNPKVASHTQVKTAICARVALRVAESVIVDTHGLCAVER